MPSCLRMSLQHWILLPVALVSATAVLAVPPKITGVSAYSAKPGDTITIQGTNFAPSFADNIVTFGPVRGVVASGSATELQVQVPYGATAAPVTVTVPGSGLAMSAWDFSPKFSPSGDIADMSFGQVNYTNNYPPQPLKPPLVNISLAQYPSLRTRLPLTCDFDRDGNPDIAVAGQDGSAIHILRNIQGPSLVIAASSFSKVTTLQVQGVLDMECGDIDGDGKPDLVVASLSPSRFFYFRNTSTPGAISFAAARTVTIPGATMSPILFLSFAKRLKLVDIDGDGRLDIALAASNLFIFRNRTATADALQEPFEQPIGFSTGSTASDLAVGDLDEDSKPDLVVASGNRAVVFRNTAVSGSFSSASLAPAILLNTAATTFAVAVSDLDSDGNPEVVAGTSGGVKVFETSGTNGALVAGSFLPRVDLPNFSGANSWGEMLVADLDGNGLREIVLGDIYGEDATILLNRGFPDLASSFSVAVRLDFGTRSFSSGQSRFLGISDLNADAKPDILTAGANTGLSISQNFTQPLTFSALQMASGGSSVKLPWFRSVSYSLSEVLSDGGKRDVTRAASWRSSAPEIAEVVKIGTVYGKTFGTTTITAGYDGHEASTSLSVLPTAFGVKPGEPDKRFLPAFSNDAVAGVVADFEFLSNGKILVVGEFAELNGSQVRNIARLNPDGTLDPSFTGTTDGRVNSVCVDGIGNFLIAGNFNTVNGVARRAAARLFPDGSLDASFNAGLNSSTAMEPKTIEVRSDGRILIGGKGLRLEGASDGAGLMQFLSSGAKDPAFSAGAYPSETVYRLIPLPDGKLLVGGQSLYLGGPDNYGLRKLLSDGSNDPAFQLGISSGSVYGLALQPDGKVVAAGDLQTAFGKSVGDIIRLNNDGTLDESFAGPDLGICNALVLQKNGKVVVAYYTSTARFNPDGTRDLTWAPTVRPDWSPSELKITADEKIWMSGGSSYSSGIPTLGIVRLHGDITTYLGWQTKYFTQEEIADEENTNPDLVKAGSNVTNLYRYSAGIAPDTSAVEDTLPRVDLIGEENDGAFTYRRPIGSSDLLDEVGVSRDLVTWDFSGDHIVRVGNPVTNSDGVTETVKFRYLPPDGNDTAVFFKLRLSLKP